MGNSRSALRRDYMLEIRQLSESKLDISDVTYLLAQSSFSPQELYSLYLKFHKLGTPQGSLISILEFVRLEEINNCPLMPRFSEAFELKIELDKFIKAQQQQQSIVYPEPKEQKETKGSTLLRKESKIDVFKPIPTNKILVDRSTVMLQCQFSSFRNNLSQLAIKFIDFKLFIKFLNPFAPAASSETKTKFMFRVFDFDDDGLLTYKDIFKGVKMMYSDHTHDTCYLTDSAITSLVLKLFSEQDIDPEEGFQYEDFQINLWETDFDNNWTIYF